MDIIHEAKTMLELAVHHLERCSYDTDCFKITIEKLKKEMKVVSDNEDKEKVCKHENTEELNGLQHCLDCGGVRDLQTKQ